MKKIISMTLLVVLIFSFAGCAKINVSKEIARVNDRVITKEEFMYFLENVKAQMLSESGTAEADDNFWKTEKDGVTFATLAKEKALEEAIRVEIACIKAEELGLTVSDADKKEIEAIFASTQSAQKEQLKEIEKQTGLFESLFKEMLLKSVLSNEYATYLDENQADLLTPSKAEINEAYNTKYVRAKHVLINLTQDAEAGSDAAQDQETFLAEKKALAEEIVKKAKAGTRFESLVAEYGEDPGMETNPDGYTFADDGSMVPEFTDAAFGLEIGEVSAPVEASNEGYHGYHIIKRYPLLTSGTEYDQIISGLTQQLTLDKFNAHLDSFKADLDIKIAEGVVKGIKVK